MHRVQVVESSDVVIEVLDARDPLGCRCPEVEKSVLESGHSKRVVLLLNKIGKIVGVGVLFCQAAWTA